MSNGLSGPPSGPTRRMVVAPPGPPPPSSDTSDARKEEEGYDRERAKDEHRRDRKTRALLAWCLWSLVVLVAVIIFASVATLGWHLVTGPRLHWLSDTELQRVKDFILSGALVGLGTNYIRRYLEPTKSPSNG